MIEVESLSKNFGKVEAVKNVSFHARDGEITALLGDNGAGKTTTIRMIAGIIKPLNGRVQIDGHAASEMRRNLGILSDAKGLYERLTSRENMFYYASLMGLPRAEIEANISKAIKILEMEEIIDRRTKGFSTGQKMKVLLGRLLAFQPRNLLLDEPTAGLDVMATRRLRSVLRNLRSEGHCIVFSTHVMQEVEQLADSVIVMHAGISLVQDSVPNLYAQTGQSTMEETFVRLVDGDGGRLYV
ncbi:MAG: ATP-binding cassette domain-containing protein [Proteobacteria bacterium]|nr:MAG: ATP-binding cassette domain-containing protein [Pseudomonadota bacterium]